jgi:hypothetical protein
MNRVLEKPRPTIKAMSCSDTCMSNCQDQCKDDPSGRIQAGQGASCYSGSQASSSS